MQEPRVTRALTTEFRDACGAAIRHLHACYGVLVDVAAIEPPLKVDLDGSSILVADHSTDEERLFLVAYLSATRYSGTCRQS